MITKRAVLSTLHLTGQRIYHLSWMKKILIVLVAFFVIGGEFYNFQNSAGTYLADTESAAALTAAPTQSAETSLLSPTASPSPVLAQTETTTGNVLGSQTKVTPTVSKSNNPTSLQGSSATATPTATPPSSPTPIPTNAPSTTPEPTSSPSPTPEAALASVSFGQAGTYTVALADGQKACDVTRGAASANGIILDIRHDNDFHSDSIWMINGIGNLNSLWWTYKINNVAPVWGCSHPNSPTIRAGDTITWEYIGS